MDSSDDIPLRLTSTLGQVSLQVEVSELMLTIGLIILLIGVSAIISGCEVAFFSLKKTDLDELQENGGEKDKQVLRLLEKPKDLLAGLLIGNNLVNITIVILSYYLTFKQIKVEGSQVVLLLVQTITVTFLLVMFGEVVPKVYASANNQKTTKVFSGFIAIMLWFFKPFSWFLVIGTDLIDKRFKQKNQQVSMDELNQAIEMTYDETPDNPEEKDILKGIVNFGNISVKQVMIPRQDIQAISMDMDFVLLKTTVAEWGYSRIPVYTESLDHIEGILYLKDLLAHMGEVASFNWQSLLRKPFFVPEKKRIDDLFRDFQTKHTHMAIVVDEYGGCAGLITLEDVLEEIVGEINDEYDDETENLLSKIDESTFLCHGKMQLQDLSKQIGFDADVFEEIKGDADTLAGLILEIAGRIPGINETIIYEGYEFVVTEADSRRISTVRITIPKPNEGDNYESDTQEI